MFKKGGTARYAAFAGARVLLYFLLAACIVLAYTPIARAASADGASTPVIADVGVFYAGTNDALGYATNAQPGTASISTKGGSLQFDHVAYWDTGDSDRNSTYVTWSVDDTSIATINNTGTLTAHADGTVTVKATASTDETGGASVVCSVLVTITGQSDSRYVSALRIISPEGDDISGDIYAYEQDLSTAMLTFTAEVDVVDPATGTTKTYSTANGTLSSQAPDLSDLVWNVGDSNMAYIEETYGIFRPSVYGLVALTVTSSAGQGGARVRASATVNTEDPSGEQEEEGYHPQDTLTIKAYYELYTPDDYGEDAYVIDKTYSVEDLESFGMITATYTALGATDYYTMTGSGPTLASVLQDAGVNIDGIKSFAFTTADWTTGENRPVSASFVFADRYWYPNIDIGSYAGAQQVFPILALTSNQVKNGSTEPDTSTMNEGTRFRLLFGATEDGGNSQYQIKWINTIYVVLAGGPPVEPDPGPDPQPDPQPTPGGGGGTGGGSGNGSGTGGGAGTVGGTALAGSSGDSGNGGSSGGSSGQFSIYQVMNKNGSDTEDLPYDNPLAALAGPLALLVFVAGGVEAYMWFRHQTRRRIQAPANGAASA